ncbi:MAG TPA: RNA-directed DNA polymerase [Gemmatimonadaceae bacterium]
MLAYLGLRYYLEGTAARTDPWAARVAAGLVLDRPVEPYLTVPHFKEVQHNGAIAHRTITVPGPNEALAEAVLLDECAKHDAFANPSCVFSYALCAGDDRTGMFQHYMRGIRERHSAIASACAAFPGGVVRYLDIRKFYPSISTQLALTTWSSFASKSTLGERERALGFRLIGGHGASNTEGDALLTGPMLSHFVANLVLRDIDVAAADRAPGRYFRYVDDIVVVGDWNEVRAHTREITARLADSGFRVHDEHSPKSFEVPTKAWLAGKDDFLETEASRNWKEFVGGLKRLLLVQPDVRTELQRAFEAEGLRIPVRDYSTVVREQGYLTSIKRWATSGWLRRWRAPSAVKLVALASNLRRVCESELKASLKGVEGLRGFDRKRRIPKLRYYAARLIYLSPNETLLEVSSRMKAIPELHFHSVVMHAVATGELDGVLALGTNAAQAAAQPLQATTRRATMSLKGLSNVEADALAVVLLNGISVAPGAVSTSPHESRLLEFAARGATLDLMRSESPFIREIACLHGINSQPRHRAILDSVYDEDEIQILDAVEMAHGSGS